MQTYRPKMKPIEAYRYAVYKARLYNFLQPGRHYGLGKMPLPLEVREALKKLRPEDIEKERIDAY